MNTIREGDKMKSKYYHTPLDYEILEKSKNYVHIRPLRIGCTKTDRQTFLYRETFGDGQCKKVELKIDEFTIWLKKKYLIRGSSGSNTKDRLVWKQGFRQMMLNAYSKQLKDTKANEIKE